MNLSFDPEFTEAIQQPSSSNHERVNSKATHPTQQHTPPSNEDQFISPSTLVIKPFQFSAPKLITCLHTLTRLGLEPSLKPLPQNPIPQESSTKLQTKIISRFNRLISKMNTMLLQDHMEEINTLPGMVTPIITIIKLETKEILFKNIDRKLRRSLELHIKLRVRHSLKALEDLRSCLEDYGLSSPSTQLSAELKDTLHSLAHIVHFNQSIVGKMND